MIHANSDDLVESVHQRIREKTGIPVFEQRLIYMGKQLDTARTLEQCCIQNDAGLHLTGRMRSTDYPQTWKVVNDLLSYIQLLCRGESLPPRPRFSVKSKVSEFLNLTTSDSDDGERVSGHFKIFKSTGAPMALVGLFLSPHPGNKAIAQDSIHLMLSPNLETLSKPTQLQCAPILLEFCKLLHGNSPHDSLYNACRSSLGFILNTIGFAHGMKYFDYATAPAMIQQLLPFVRELADKLIVGLDSCWNSLTCARALLETHVCDFIAFLRPLRMAIVDHVGGDCELPLELNKKHPCYMDEMESLHDILLQLLEKISECLSKVEGILISKGAAGEIESHRFGCDQYIPLLKDLNNICKLYKGANDVLISVIWSRRLPLNYLIRQLKRSERIDEHSWLLDLKDVTDFESRRHLVMMMFPKPVDEYEELHEMLIDRSHLLEESFEYIARADRQSFRGGLFMEFKNEEATGPGVLREWFYLVCHALFNPQNPLFLACPNDHRRFYPNPASKVDSLHLDYFGFCGRMIALALLNKVHVGITFDRVFFLQLADKSVSLEDVRDADPCLYMSCKKILEMDAEFLDSDALGLTFVREIEELGSRKMVELRDGGKDIIVNSKNREEYVNLLINHQFVTSISEQVARFARGFGDILSNPRLQKLFFRSLELEDLDRMLYGSENNICVKEWKAHTDYNGYKKTDRQICWFWKVVEGMSLEQQRVLLFFWTSVKYLPFEGFHGLASRLYIYKASDSHDRLPSSHTCFFRLCLPPYPSKAAMRSCLHLIAQEHVSCSFGTW